MSRFTIQVTFFMVRSWMNEAEVPVGALISTRFVWWTSIAILFRLGLNVIS